LGRASGGNGEARIMGTGVWFGGANQELWVASCPHGILTLKNAGRHVLDVWICSAGGVRVLKDRLTLGPGQSQMIPVQRRRTLRVRRLDDYSVAVLRGRVQPLDGEGRPVGRLIEVSEFDVIGKRHAPPALVVPEGPIHWDLPTRGQAGQWYVPVQMVGGRAPAEAVLRHPGPGGQEIPVSIVASEENTSPTRKGRVVIAASPSRLIEWFPGPIDRLAGALELCCGSQNGKPRVVVASFPFTARLLGAVWVARSVAAGGRAGHPCALRLDLLASEGLGEALTARWSWQEKDAPYEMSCALVSDRPADVLDAEARVEQALPELALQANAARKQSRWVVLSPRGATGWEQGQCRGEIALVGADGRTTDAIPMLYTFRPFAPRAEIRLTRQRERGSPVAFQVELTNPNPYGPLRLSNLDLQAQFRVPGGWRVDGSMEMDPRELPLEIPPGGRWTGSGRVLPRPAFLKALASRLAGAMDVTISIRAEPEGRLDSALSWPIACRANIGRPAPRRA
jgi:hypothetical protein